MSYVAIATEQFDAMEAFYGQRLGFPVVDAWDRLNARGVRFDLGGMRLEILDNTRQRSPLPLGTVADGFHIVIEVEDIEAAYHMLDIDAPKPQGTSWGARVFQLRDPDGIPVTYLEWTSAAEAAPVQIIGRLASGLGRGSHFTSLDWVRAQFVERIGIDPHPGTANLLIDDPASRKAWQRLRQQNGITIDNPNTGPRDCSARCFLVSVEGEVDAAIVLPEVAGYAENQIELIAPVGLREALGKTDGDPSFCRSSNRRALMTHRPLPPAGRAPEH